jgi:uncharacterized protein
MKDPEQSSMGTQVLERWDAEGCAAQAGPLGYGLVAVRAFEKDEVIFEVTGDLVSLDRLNEKYGEDSANSFQVGADAYIYPSGPGRYVNHSCEPNAGLINDVQMIALRPIQAGEPICFDYSTCMSENLWTMPCLCGEARCRGTITDFHNLPSLLKSKALQSGVVQRFIVNEVFSQHQASAPAGTVPHREAASQASALIQ